MRFIKTCILQSGNFAPVSRKEILTVIEDPEQELYLYETTMQVGKNDLGSIWKSGIHFPFCLWHCQASFYVFFGTILLSHCPHLNLCGGLYLQQLNWFQLQSDPRLVTHTLKYKSGNDPLDHVFLGKVLRVDMFWWWW
jgi:hypothetical protein